MRRLLHLLDEVGDEMGGLSSVTSPVEGQHREVAGHLAGGARISIAYSGPWKYQVSSMSCHLVEWMNPVEGYVWPQSWVRVSVHLNTEEPLSGYFDSRTKSICFSLLGRPWQNITDLNNRNLSSHSSGWLEVPDQGVGSSVSLEASVLGWKTAAFLLSPHRVFPLLWAWTLAVSLRVLISSSWGQWSDWIRATLLPSL